MSTTENLQKEHYDRIFSDYEKHYDDEWSQRYRREFVYGPMFRNVEVRGKRVLEAMCGSGQSTRFLLDHGAEVVGLDISPEAIASFRQRWGGADAICASILDSKVPDESFDCVVVVAGLHHLHPHLDDAVREIGRLLKPNGHFFFVEPHAGSLPDWFRILWYRNDRKYFAENEASVDVERLIARHADTFDVVSNTHFGGVAWILVVNSLILRIPHELKAYYTPALLGLERWTMPLQSRVLSCMAACILKKKAR